MCCNWIRDIWLLYGVGMVFCWVGICGVGCVGLDFGGCLFGIGMNCWNECYVGEEFLFGIVLNVFFVVQCVCFLWYGKVLVVVDGEGCNGVWLVEQGLDVLVVDVFDVGLVKSCCFVVECNVFMVWELVDLLNWDFGCECFDVIVVIFIQFVDFVLCMWLFVGMVVVFKFGGVLLLEGYCLEQFGYGMGGLLEVVNLYIEVMLCEVFVELMIEYLVVYDVLIYEGNGYYGMLVLIDLVVCKLD